MNETILVVDDEERIRSSLRGILRDEGFRVLDTGNPPAVMDMIAREQPSLVLLDVWMPEIDGIELLRQIKSERPDTRVIMISGHANIQSAVAATRLGAADFIEKPFSVDGLMSSVARALKHPVGASPPSDLPSGDSSAGPAKTAAAGRAMRRQRTVARPIVIGGQGLHSGLKTGVILQPAPVGSGIVFSSLGDEQTVAARLENVSDTGYNTTLSSGGCSVRTVEHLLSVLHAFGITNLTAKGHAEVSALDGSALEFCTQLLDAGVEDQDGIVEPVRVSKPIVIGTEGEREEYIRLDPADVLSIDYTLDYPAPIGVQQVHFELTSPQAYAREIAPARTFTFVHEFRRLTEMGLGFGGRLDNLILLDDEKVVNTTLRFPDEFARHKVLDLIGDLYLLGRPLLGHITASKSGHSDNLALVRAVRDSL